MQKKSFVEKLQKQSKREIIKIERKNARKLERTTLFFQNFAFIV
jgi:hypothetical protein